MKTGKHSLSLQGWIGAGRAADWGGQIIWGLISREENFLRKKNESSSTFILFLETSMQFFLFPFQLAYIFVLSIFVLKMVFNLSHLLELAGGQGLLTIFRDGPTTK